MVECYILQWLAAGSTSSNGQVLHDKTGTLFEVPQKLKQAVTLERDSYSTTYSVL
jgi:hypothetical protein